MQLVVARHTRDSMHTSSVAPNVDAAMSTAKQNNDARRARSQLQASNAPATLARMAAPPPCTESRTVSPARLLRASPKPPGSAVPSRLSLAPLAWDGLLEGRRCPVPITAKFLVRLAQPFFESWAPSASSDMNDGNNHAQCHAGHCSLQTFIDELNLPPPPSQVVSWYDKPPRQDNLKPPG